MNRPNAIVVGSEISPSFLGLVRRAFELCSERELSLTAVIVSSTEPVDAGQLIYAGADRLARIALSVQDINAPVAAAESISQYALSEKPEFILFESSSFFCCVAPMTAAKLSCGITADCTALSWAEHGTLRQTRPAFGGRKLAHIENTCTPVLATVRKGVFKLSFSENTQKVGMPLIPCCEAKHIWTQTRIIEDAAQTLRAQTSSSPEGSAWAAGKTSKSYTPLPTCSVPQSELRARLLQPDMQDMPIRSARPAFL